MHSVKMAACVAATVLGLGLTAASASDEQVASVTTCLSTASEVRTALDNNTQSANYDEAKKERTYGNEFCGAGFYAKGIAHYNHALALLGVSVKAEVSTSH